MHREAVLLYTKYSGDVRTSPSEKFPALGRLPVTGEHAANYTILPPSVPVHGRRAYAPLENRLFCAKIGLFLCIAFLLAQIIGYNFSEITK